MEENGIIIFRRWPRLVYKIRRFDIVIDDQKVGSIADGKEERFTVSPGLHTVELRVSWIIKSKPQIVEIKPGEQVLLECGTPLTVQNFIIPGLVIAASCFDKLISFYPLKIVLWCLGLLGAGYYLWLYKGKDKFICLREPTRILP